MAIVVPLGLIEAIKISRCSTDKGWGERLIIDAANREIENENTRRRLAAAILKAKGKE